MRLIIVLVAASILAVPIALGKGPFPPTIPLPNGWQPEGIAIANGKTFYAGSRATGAVYSGDLRTGKGAVLVQGVAGRAATGLKFNHGRLFVSGAGTGKAFIYNARTGALIREYQLASAPTFINDVVVTNDAAYFTDSNRAAIFKLPLGFGGTLPGAAQTLPLTGDFQLVAGFNLNGIVATPNGKTLIAVQSNTGKLFTIDPNTGVTRLIDLGGATVMNGDGLLLHGKSLFVVQNQNNRIAVAGLAPDIGSGTINRTITSPNFDVPTTVAMFGSRLYAVNARFTTPPTPTTTYSVVQFKR
jgi:outer membrane protein assembly factor BamB